MNETSDRIYKAITDDYKRGFIRRYGWQASGLVAGQYVKEPEYWGHVYDLDGAFHLALRDSLPEMLRKPFEDYKIWLRPDIGLAFIDHPHSWAEAAPEEADTAFIDQIRWVNELIVLGYQVV